MKHCYDYTGVTKQDVIRNARNAVAAGFDFSKVGYGTIEKFIKEIELIDQTLFSEFFTLKKGDHIVCLTTDTFGVNSRRPHIDTVMSGPHGGFMFNGDGDGVSVWSGGYPQTVFLHGFCGKRK